MWKASKGVSTEFMVSETLWPKVWNRQKCGKWQKKNVLGTRYGNAILFGMKQHCDMKIKFYTNKYPRVNWVLIMGYMYKIFTYVSIYNSSITILCHVRDTYVPPIKCCSSVMELIESVSELQSWIIDWLHFREIYLAHGIFSSASVKMFESHIIKWLFSA
jgi:hypothetical protein